MHNGYTLRVLTCNPESTLRNGFACTTKACLRQHVACRWKGAFPHPILPLATLSGQINFKTPYEQIWAVILLAVVGGYLGCLFISFNTWVCVVRKKWTKFMWARIAEVGANRDRVRMYRGRMGLATALACADCRLPSLCEFCSSSLGAWNFRDP